MNKSEIINLKMNKKDIALLKFIFEASDGVGLTSTVDVKTGHVIVMAPPGSSVDAMEVLDSVKETIDFEIV